MWKTVCYQSLGKTPTSLPRLSHQKTLTQFQLPLERAWIRKVKGHRGALLRLGPRRRVSGLARRHFRAGSAIWLRRTGSMFPLVSWSFHKHLQTALAARHRTPPSASASAGVDSSAPRERRGELRKQRFGSAALIPTFLQPGWKMRSSFYSARVHVGAAVISTNAPSATRRFFFAPFIESGDERENTVFRAEGTGGNTEPERSEARRENEMFEWKKGRQGVEFYERREVSPQTYRVLLHLRKGRGFRDPTQQTGGDGRAPGFSGRTTWRNNWELGCNLPLSASFTVAA